LNGWRKHDAPRGSLLRSLSTVAKWIVLPSFVASLSAPVFAQFMSQTQLGWPGKRLDGTNCRGNSGGVGPFDYTDPRNDEETLRKIYRAHFAPQVERLIHAQSSSLLADLDYTLRAIPNQHRALFSVIRLAFLRRRDYAGRLIYGTNAKTPPECYLQRAIKFRPNDGQVRVLFGIYLFRRKQYKMALAQLDTATKLLPTSAEAHYNRGLTLVKLKRFKLAQAEAKRAYDLGYPLHGLRNQLKKRGYWK